MSDFLYRNRIYTNDEIQALTNELAAIDISLPADKAVSNACKNNEDSANVKRTYFTR